MERLNNIILSASGVVGVELAERLTSFAPTDAEQVIGLVMQIAIALATIIKLFKISPEEKEFRLEKRRLRKLESEEKRRLRKL